MGHEQHADEATAFWNERYGDAPIWSGRVNAAVVGAVGGLTPGRALELGCGEGGDAIWLAAHGWSVTAVDIAESAIDRGRAAAAQAGADVAERITWRAADLTTWATDERFDLVTASFLHSPVAFPRRAVLLRAADAVAPGGHLLVVGHAAFPPWSSHADHDAHTPSHEGSRLFSAAEQLADLDLDPAMWEVAIAEDRPRSATGPHGERATLDDAVVLVRRH